MSIVVAPPSAAEIVVVTALRAARMLFPPPICIAATQLKPYQPNQGVAAQVKYESKGLKPAFHFIVARVERNQALSFRRRSRRCLHRPSQAMGHTALNVYTGPPQDDGADGLEHGRLLRHFNQKMPVEAPHA
jgi:hypothetical protein